jgi:hypothetical protein
VDFPLSDVPYGLLQQSFDNLLWRVVGHGMRDGVKDLENQDKDSRYDKVAVGGETSG